MIRDRKMYVAPTPYSVAEGLTGTRTLVIPSDWTPPQGFKTVGRLDRVEAQEVVVGYSFDLQTNTITPTTIPNSDAEKVHSFIACRLENDSDKPVSINRNTIEAGGSDDEE